jgi:hypothetical protein
MDFNNAEAQREIGGLIDDGTIAVVHLTVKPGMAGEGGWLKRSKVGDSQALDCEFTVVDGNFAKRKFWSLFTVEGETEGQKKAAEISASRLRAILESSRGINPTDESDTAKAARRVSAWGDFDGIRFIAKIGVEHAKKDSGYKDKNTLVAAITPDRRDWHKVEQVTKQAASPSIAPAAHIAAAATTSGKPSWAS